jgi:fructose-1,6-bisphosphatase/inositol monophosphatase family enzyme
VVATARETFPVQGLPPWVAPLIFRLHDAIRATVRGQLAVQPADDLTRVAHKGEGDVSFAIDVPAESMIETILSDAPEPIVAIAEGLGTVVFPRGAAVGDARVRLIIDPLDGTRELMYQKRSAWVLTGAAPNRGEETTLRDIVFGAMTEVPPTSQGRGVRAWSTRGHGAFERLWDVDKLVPLGGAYRLATSRTPTIRGGFATFAHFFPGTHRPLGALADEVLESVLGPVVSGAAESFDDCYISTGGQLHLLASGRYRLVVDPRALLPDQGLRGGGRPLCAHPYDLGGATLVAEEAGAIIQDLAGDPLGYPLDTSTDCGYIAFANPAIRDEVWPSLRAGLSRLTADT